MRRTAAGSALVCVGFALGAVGATLAGPPVHSTAIAFLHAGQAPYLTVAGRTRSVPSPAASRRSLSVAALGARTSRPGVPAVPPTAASDVRPTTQVSPAPAQAFSLSVGDPALAVATGYDLWKKSCPDTTGPHSLAVSLDPARAIDAAALNLCRILTGLPSLAPGQH